MALLVVQDASIVLQWNELLLAAVRVAGPTPTVVARALAVLHNSIYDAWAAYDAKAIDVNWSSNLRTSISKVTPVPSPILELESHAGFLQTPLLSQ